MKIGLIIAKGLSCLIVMTMLSEARVHWFDTIWLTLWALLVETQSQTNLLDDVFLRHSSEQCATSSEHLQKDEGDQSSQAICHRDVRHLTASVHHVFLQRGFPHVPASKYF